MIKLTAHCTKGMPGNHWTIVLPRGEGAREGGREGGSEGGRKGGKANVLTASPTYLTATDLFKLF